jgi:hypothetical protein
VGGGKSHILVAKPVRVMAGGDGTDKLAYSYDGITWTASASGTTVFTGGTCGAVAWNGRMFVCVGTGTTASNCIIYSYNGINWFSTGQTEQAPEPQNRKHPQED